MEAIANDELVRLSADDPLQKDRDALVISGEVKGVAIEMKSYVLDDFKALKKKWDMVNHKPVIDVNGEATNGSSINIDMKTALFEMMKNGLVNDLKKEKDIRKIDLPVTSKAQAKNGEEADVEYHLDITFAANDVVERVKMKCYTTNCRVQIQNFGKHEKKKHLNDEFTPKYFDNRFVIPYLESVLNASTELEKVLVPHLRSEIQRLQKKRINDKIKKVPAIEVEAKTAMCENQNCQHKFNVNLKNVEAYGQCSVCKGFEHHHCAGTSKMMKDEIKLGNANFVCTNCMENNPALGKDLTISTPKQNLVTSFQVNALVHDKPNVPDVIIATESPVSMEELSSPADASPQFSETENPSSDITNKEIKEKCNECPFECSSKNELGTHKKEEHEVSICSDNKCDYCEMTFDDASSLQSHIETSHTTTDLTCEICDYKTTDISLLETHVKFTHTTTDTYICTICGNSFDEESVFNDHKQLHHAPLTSLCDMCAHEANSDDDLEKHKRDDHTNTADPMNVAPKVSEEQDKGKLIVENKELQRKLILLEDSYNRLMGMFQKQQTESKDKALAFKTELEEAHEGYRVAKTENEKLKEINETQHKLWKIFIDKFEKDNSEKEKISTRETEPEDTITIDETPEDDDIDDLVIESTYQEWLKDAKNRGFKRTSPSSPAEKVIKPPQGTNVKGPRRQQKTFSEAASSSATTSPQSSPPSSQPSFQPSESRKSTSYTNTKYCHFWNNQGKCSYNDCKFEHQDAPFCLFDGNCSRPKCMFRHKKQNMNFLSNRTNQTISPWQSMVNPWSNPFAFQPNPWQNSAQGQRNRN